MREQDRHTEGTCFLLAASDYTCTADAARHKTVPVSPLADVQFISARDGEGGASRDSDGFDEMDWTVWNRISL